MRLDSSLLWLRLAWQPKKAKIFCLLSHTDLLDPIRDHLSLKQNKNKVCIKQHLFHHAIVFMGRVSINAAEISPL